MTRLPAAADARLRTALASHDEVLEFARAVVLHLSLDGRSAAANADRVAGALVIALNDTDPTAAAPTPDPELLASFFQNADLLDPTRPTTHRVAHWVMESVERLGKPG